MKIVTVFLIASAAGAGLASPLLASGNRNIDPAPESTRSTAVQTAEVDAEETWEPTSATRIVCRDMPQRVGSRIGTRNICATAQQWDRWRQENRDVLENAGNRNSVGAR